MKLCKNLHAVQKILFSRKLFHFIGISTVFILFSVMPILAHEVEFVILGGAKVRFQYANGQPMQNAEIHIQDENKKIIAAYNADDYGVFDYEKYFGTAARLTALHNNYTVHFILPETLPRVVHNDRGELVEIVVPAGFGGRLSSASVTFVYVCVIGCIVFFAYAKLRSKKPTLTGKQIAMSRRIPRNSY